MEEKIEKWTLEDGRRAERHVKETPEERVIELHVEEERPLHLQQRIVEKTKPFIYEREIQTVDKSGEVVDKKIESIEPKIQMHLVEHISNSNSYNVESNAKTCNCLKKEDIAEIVFNAIKNSSYKNEESETVKSLSVDNVKNVDGIKSFGLAQEIANRQNNSSEESELTDKVLMGIIVLLTCAIAYMLLFTK